MLKQVRDTFDGKKKDGKPSTKSGHISDVEFEPLPPLLVSYDFQHRCGQRPFAILKYVASSEISRKCKTFLDHDTLWLPRNSG